MNAADGNQSVPLRLGGRRWGTSPLASAADRPRLAAPQMPRPAFLWSAAGARSRGVVASGAGRQQPPALGARAPLHVASIRIAVLVPAIHLLLLDLAHGRRDGDAGSAKCHRGRAPSHFSARVCRAPGRRYVVTAQRARARREGRAATRSAASGSSRDACTSARRARPSTSCLGGIGPAFPQTVRARGSRRTANDVRCGHRLTPAPRPCTAGFVGSRRY